METFRYIPHTAVIHITEFCDHRCTFCYAAKDNLVYNHANLNTLYRIADELIVSGIRNISLLGGDPALHPHLVPLAKYIKNINPLVTISVMSNTLEINGYSKNEIIKYISCFETTIHHAEGLKHDSFCGLVGAYRKVVNNLKEYSDLGATTGIAINIIPYTVDIIYNLVFNLIVKEKIALNYVVIQRIIPFGRARNRKEFFINIKEANLALKQIKRIDEELGIRIYFEDSFPICIVKKEYRKYMHPCEWGITKLALNGKGDLSRCGADPRYLLGNILEKPLLEIWNNSKTLELFRSKDYLSEKCKKCPNIDLCGGGCPLSKINNNDLGNDYLSQFS